MFRRVLDEVFKWLPWTPTGRVVMLAKEYDASGEEERERFLEDFLSRLQLTYRSGISTPLKLVGGKEIDSDSGWGCMLRVSQMMLAQCFISFTLGRDWRFQKDRDLEEGSLYLQVLSCFLDTPKAPFSLHGLVDAGQALLGKEPSAWFGPTSAAKAVRHLFGVLEQRRKGGGGEALDFLQRLACAVFEDGAIFKASVLERFDRGAEGVIILVCRRLGLDEFNLEEYRPGVEACFALPEFMGLASGNSGSSAHYFVGTHDDCLLFLDPHRTQPSLESLDPGVVAEAGLHPTRPLPLRWARLNPSVCLGFLVRSPDEFRSLCTKLTSDPLGEVFEVLEKAPNYGQREAQATEEDDMILLA